MTVVQWLDRLDDDLFAAYALSPGDIAALRARFSDWPRVAVSDDVAQAAHDAVHRPPPTAP